MKINVRSILIMLIRELCGNIIPTFFKGGYRGDY